MAWRRAGGPDAVESATPREVLLAREISRSPQGDTPVKILAPLLEPLERGDRPAAAAVDRLNRVLERVETVPPEGGGGLRHLAFALSRDAKGRAFFPRVHQAIVSFGSKDVQAAWSKALGKL